MSYKPNLFSGKLDLTYSDPFSFVSGYNQLSLPKTKTALHKVKVGPYSGTQYQAKVLFIGDSVTAGTAANKASCGLAECFARELNTVFPSRSDNFIGGEKGTGSASALVTYDPRFSIGADWTTFGPGQTFGGSPFYWGAGGAVNNLAFTPAGSFDRIDLYYLSSDAPWGNATVNVDGGSSLGTLAGGTGLDYKKLTVNCTAGTHTINIVPATANVCVSGLMAWTSTASAVHVFNGGRAGVRTDLYSDATYPWSPINSLSEIQPDLCFLMLDINDTGADGTGVTAIETYTTQYTTIVNGLIAAGSEVILVSSPPNNGLGSGVIDTYRQVARNLSVSLGVPHVDLSKLWSNFAAYSAAGMSNDANHPNAAGTSFMARALARFLINIV
jgi:lysophospholipase L1-like esterase